MEHKDENPDMTYACKTVKVVKAHFKITVQSENSNSEPVFKSNLKLWCKNKKTCKT